MCDFDSYVDHDVYLSTNKFLIEKEVRANTLSINLIVPKSIRHKRNIVSINYQFNIDNYQLSKNKKHCSYQFNSILNNNNLTELKLDNFETISYIDWTEKPKQFAKNFKEKIKRQFSELYPENSNETLILNKENITNLNLFDFKTEEIQPKSHRN